MSYGFSSNGYNNPQDVPQNPYRKITTDNAIVYTQNLTQVGLSIGRQAIIGTTWRNHNKINLAQNNIQSRPLHSAFSVFSCDALFEAIHKILWLNQHAKPITHRIPRSSCCKLWPQAHIRYAGSPIIRAHHKTTSQEYQARIMHQQKTATDNAAYHIAKSICTPLRPNSLPALVPNAIIHI